MRDVETELEVIRNDVIKEMPDDSKTSFILLSSARMAAIRHLGEAWEPLMMEVGAQVVRIMKVIDGLPENLEGALEVGRRLGLYTGYSVEDSSVRLTNCLEVLGWEHADVEARCTVTKGLVLEGLRMEGRDVVELEEEVDGTDVMFRWEERA